MSHREVKEYLSHHLIPQLLESLLTGLLYHRPDDPVSFLHGCLIRIRQLGGPEAITWDTFTHLDRDQLTPGTPKTALETLPLLPPIIPPVSPTSSVAPLTHSGPQLHSIKLNTSVITSLTPSVSSGPPQTTTEPRVLLPALPGPAGPPCVPPPVQNEVKEEDTKSGSSEALPPPGLPRPPPVWSQLSIDSDSLMVNKSVVQEETISELKRQLIGQKEVRGFIVDGFPRDVHQALSFQEQIGSPDLVVLLLCSNETLSCRLQQRASQLGLLGDSSHTLQRCLDTFQRDIVSVRRFYRQTHLLIQVDADRDEEVVFADLSSVIRGKLQLKDQSDPTGDVPDVLFNIRSVHQ